MVSDDKLERYLTSNAFAWEVIPMSRHKLLENEWESIYGSVWKSGLRHMGAARAEEAYRRTCAETFLIVPFLGDHAGPHGLSTRWPRTCAYECRGPGDLPELSSFSNLDFFVSPPDLSWTMVHTHEDYSLGGPYFVDKELLVPRTRRRRFGG